MLCEGSENNPLFNLKVAGSLTVFHQTGMVRTEVETAGSDIVKSKCRQAPPNTFSYPLREDINRKKSFLSGIARMRGGGLPIPEFFGPFFKKSIFSQ